MKILVTGGSGFIGTNLIEDLLKKGYEVRSIDWKKPKISKHKNIWEDVDITQYTPFEKSVFNFKPDYIVHLAARTDLDGKTLEDYAANLVGVENILSIVTKLPDLKKIIIASSKFVTKNGYKIKNQHDYCPHTKYGESKVKTEILVWKAAKAIKCDWCIIRPTSIWGPWFGIPYRNFFDLVMKKMYFHIGHIKCHKTYGYIGNAIYQIEQLLFNETSSENNKVFYIGDEPAYEINEWANEIAGELDFVIPTMPIWFVKLLAKFGDFLGLFGFHFPMQSFRLENMTNDGINDLKNTYQIAPAPPFTRLEGTKMTIQWIRNCETLNGRKN